MANILTLEPARRDQVVTEAIQREAPVVLTLRREGGWTTLKTTFLRRATVGRHMAVLAPAAFVGGQEPPLQTGECVGVSFRRGHKKCVFATTAKTPECGSADEGGAARVWLLGWPDTLQELQRRVYYRAVPPPGRVVRVDVWRGHCPDPSPAQPAGSPDFSGTLEDISVGGVRILLSEPASLGVGSPVMCAWPPRGETQRVLASALFRHVETRRAGYSHGFQFVGLELRPDGPAVLSRLARFVTELQRAAARRHAPGTVHRGCGPQPPPGCLPSGGSSPSTGTPLHDA